MNNILEQSLFQDSDNLEWWQDEWQNMPEFIQKKQIPYATIVVRFMTKEDLDDFSKTINQKLTKRTKSIWHPFRSHWGGNKKRWRDES